MNKVDEIFKESENIVEFSKKYTAYLSNLMANLNFEKIEEITQLFVETMKKGKTIYFLGNGGSAATASHFACDFGKGCKTEKYKFKVDSLSDHIPTFTAYGNDEGYGSVFVGQLHNVLEKDDVIVVISASGNSINLVEAVNYAKEVKARSVGLLGFDGGVLGQKCDIALIIETLKGEYGPVEDIHLILDHIIANYLMRAFMKGDI